MRRDTLALLERGLEDESGRIGLQLPRNTCSCCRPAERSADPDGPVDSQPDERDRRPKIGRTEHPEHPPAPLTRVLSFCCTTLYL